MIHSMTGFGSASIAVGETTLVFELRSHNHRYLDLGLRLPRRLGGVEGELRRLISGVISRGKLDATVHFAGTGAAPESIQIDTEAATRYVEAARELNRRHQLRGALQVGQLLALPGVARLVDRPLPVEDLHHALDAGVREAAAALCAMRAAEGAALENDLRQQLGRCRELVGELENLSAGVQRAARERLRKRAAALRSEIGPLDEARLAQELAHAADRLDLNEELVRLRSHLEQFAQLLSAARPGDPVGRRLEFLLQEMLREGNTIGAKAADAVAAHAVVELKNAIERMREQAQNVE